MGIGGPEAGLGQAGGLDEDGVWVGSPGLPWGGVWEGQTYKRCGV